MPGAGIPGFKRHAEAIARAGLYNMTQHHDQILVPIVLRAWRVESLTGLTAEGEQSRDRLVTHISRVSKVARRMAERAREKVGEAVDGAKETLAAWSDRASSAAANAAANAVSAAAAATSAVQRTDRKFA